MRSKAPGHMRPIRRPITMIGLLSIAIFGISGCSNYTTRNNDYRDHRAYYTPPVTAYYEYYYYPEQHVYYDLHRRVYHYYHYNRGWVSVIHLPAHIHLSRHYYKPLRYRHNRPWHEAHAHKRHRTHHDRPRAVPARNPDHLRNQRRPAEVIPSPQRPHQQQRRRDGIRLHDQARPARIKPPHGSRRAQQPERVEHRRNQPRNQRRDVQPVPRGQQPRGATQHRRQAQPVQIKPKPSKQQRRLNRGVIPRQPRPAPKALPIETQDQPTINKIPKK